MTESDSARTAYLKITDLWKAFGDFIALQDISLAILEGEFVCFLGPSGCGKTTLLRAIAGLDVQSRGRIEQAGQDISRLPPSERDYGIVFQSYALFPNLSIRRNIAYGLENSRQPADAIEARVNELLDLISLPDQGDKYPAQLSGGQQQRVALARAIATQPGLLLLDEPLSALDAKVRVALRHQIKELQRHLGVTTIMVTHDQEEALSMADRIVVMNQGVIEQTGTPKEIYRDPNTLFVADFIGEMNQFAAVAADNNSIQVGDSRLHCMPHAHESGHPIVATIRPEDIVPLAETHNPADNLLAATIQEMEFLGSYWRARLACSSFEGAAITANFSMNAVRRLDIESRNGLTIELPADRIKVFSPSDLPH